jgi:hypothetical protein
MAPAVAIQQFLDANVELNLCSRFPLFSPRNYQSKLHSISAAYPKAIPFVAAINISSLSLNPFSVSKHTEKYSELDTCGARRRRMEVKISFFSR